MGNVCCDVKYGNTRGGDLPIPGNPHSAKLEAVEDRDGPSRRNSLPINLPGL